jgi:hypothetical protein
VGFVRNSPWFKDRGMCCKFIYISWIRAAKVMDLPEARR